MHKKGITKLKLPKSFVFAIFVFGIRIEAEETIVFKQMYLCLPNCFYSHISGSDLQPKVQEYLKQLVFFVQHFFFVKFLVFSFSFSPRIFFFAIFVFCFRLEVKETIVFETNVFLSLPKFFNGHLGKPQKRIFLVALKRIPTKKFSKKFMD